MSFVVLGIIDTFLVNRVLAPIPVFCSVHIIVRLLEILIRVIFTVIHIHVVLSDSTPESYPYLL